MLKSRLLYIVQQKVCHFHLNIQDIADHCPLSISCLAYELLVLYSDVRSSTATKQLAWAMVYRLKHYFPGLHRIPSCLPFTSTR
jgi:hypothetical protein